MDLKPSNFSEFLEYMLIVDDDNAYLNDGTPRIKNICKSFNIHNITNQYCEFNEGIIINEVMYDPEQSEFYNEWVELYNNGSLAINFSGWELCNNEILPGYVNREGNVNLDEGYYLIPKGYAIITDGTSGTEVYDNFNVSNNSIAFHIDSASLCGSPGLNNDGDTIIIKNSTGTVFDTFTYGVNLTADQGQTLCKLNNTWHECNPTPGYENSEGIIGLNEVDRIIDGDTFVLSNNERVRLIGIDTPEIREYYYQEAKDRLIELINNREVYLERDVENKDFYDRLLRYVYVNETFVNLLLVEEGYAKAYPYEPNTKYKNNFTEAEEYARRNALGLWNISFEGNLSDVNSNIGNLTLELGNYTNGTREIMFRENNQTLLEFNITSNLNLSNITIEKQSDNNF